MLDAADGYRRPRLGRVVLLLQLAFVSTGCAGMTASGGSGSSRGSFDAVMGEELRQSSSNNVYDALRDLRPQWFRAPRSSLPDLREGSRSSGIHSRGQGGTAQYPPRD